VYVIAKFMKLSSQTAIEHATKLFRARGGILRTGEARVLGVHPTTLYKMRDVGLVEALSRGLYHLGEMPIAGNEDLVTVALRVPKARICLISALAFHELTTQIPHKVYCAIPRDVHRPRLDHPPAYFFRFSKASYADGLACHDVNGVCVRIYSAEKTLADCFKYRQRVGMDTVLEALRLYRERKRLRVDEILAHARTCRVENVMCPYLEAHL
jgi:predicted transcriptional regulator of viral defense system